MRKAYQQEITWMDNEIGKFLDWIKSEGLYDDTVIVVTADHGEEFLEHGGWWHGTTLYEEQIHVPLIVKLADGRWGGTRVPWQVRQMDTAATLAALAGAMLPFGAHKGSAIATMIELLAGAMIGDLTSEAALAALGTTDLGPRHGELVLAFSPERFAAGRPGEPFALAETLLDGIIGQGARLPSQRRFAARKDSIANGIRLTEAEFALLDRLETGGLNAVAV